ncbi:Multi-sensor hybrid histidine kinase [Oleispira antarctica RB-8]|uniref:histidine kinase n=1 Tax=Oleispira antarctica RB-8 TaxID=698738 RepID=R4YP78_OLEAN|nr:Multi-sensor hybrid histidine kinase [Oleispira antarctica RB-8]
MRSLSLFRKSLVGRLTLAFSLLAFLLLFLITLASLSLYWVNQADQYLYDQALPASKAARQLLLSSSALADNAQELDLVQEERQRQVVGRKLSINSASMFDAISKLNKLQVNTDLNLKQTASNIVANLANLGEHVGQRMRVAYSLNLQGKSLVTAANKSTELLQAELAVVDSAILAKLSLAYPETVGIKQTSQLLDDVIELDIDTQERLNRALKIVHNITLMGQVFQSLKLDLNFITFINDSPINEKDKQQETYSHYIYDLKVLDNLKGIIRDPVRASVLETQLKSLHQLPESIRLQQQFTRHITSQNLQLQTINDQLHALNKIINHSIELHQVHAVDARTAYLQQLSWLKIGLWITGLLMIFIMVIIAYQVIYRGIVLKLNQATLAMTQLIDTQDFNSQGADEIAVIASAIEVFKQKTIHNQVLQTELRETASQLSEHKQALEIKVAERTKELAKTNIQLDKEAKGHIDARNMAEQANQAKSLFLATISHEIRTPLNGLLGTLTLLGQSDLPPAQQKMLSLSHYSGTLLQTVLNDVLDFSRLEQGKITNEPRPINIQQLLDEVIAIMLAGASLAGLRLILVTDSLPTWINIDGPKLRQVLLNLIGNAIKFTTRGEIQLNVTIIDQQLAVKVQDSGMGISASEQKHLFKSYSTLPNKGRSRGTGLGLSISKQLVCLMKEITSNSSDNHLQEDSQDYSQEDLWVNSKEGEGSCFGFELPFTICQEAEISPLEKPQSVANKNVLIIEDNQINAMTAQGFLAHLGHSSVLINSCENARVLFDQKGLSDIDAIMLDIQLTDGSGLDLLTEIKLNTQTYEYPPIIAAFTAQLQANDIKHYQTLGFDHVLAKPLDMSVLANWLGTAQNEIMNRDNNQTFMTDISPGVSSELIDQQQLKDDLQYLGLEAVTNMLHLYQDSSQQHIDQLSLFPQDAPRLLHALKGSSYSMGLIALGNLCQVIEEALNESHQGYQAEQHRQLQACWQLSLRGLKDVLAD